MNTKVTLFEGGRIAAAALIVLLLFLLAGNSPKGDIPLEGLESAALPLLKEGEYQPGDGRMLRRFYGLNPADYEGVAFYYPSTNMGVEELLLIKLTDASQGEAVEQAIGARLAAQKESFDGYGVEQTDMLNNHAVVEVRGRYVLFTVSENDQKIRQAFLDQL